MEPREIIISKRVMPYLPPGYSETLLGDFRGASRQFRGRGGVHVREYRDYYTVHVDRADPRGEPLTHLLLDAPETLAAAAVGVYVASRACRGVGLLAPLAGALGFLAGFHITCRVGRLVRRILGG